MKIGDRVKTLIDPQSPELGIIVGKSLSPYDWWVKIDNTDCNEPYRESELELV